MIKDNIDRLVTPDFSKGISRVELSANAIDHWNLVLFVFKGKLFLRLDWNTGIILCTYSFLKQILKTIIVCHLRLCIKLSRDRLCLSCQLVIGWIQTLMHCCTVGLIEQ